MIRPRGWFAEKLAAVAGQVASREITLDEGTSAVAEVILRDPDLSYAVAAMYAGRRLRALSGSRDVHGQQSLFPDLPKIGPVLEIAVNRFKAVAAMTAADWDSALKQIATKAESAGTKEKQVRAAYERVRPLLSGDLVTADVLGQIRDDESGQLGDETG